MSKVEKTLYNPWRSTQTDWSI